jgi:hypothetical protein
MEKSGFVSHSKLVIPASLGAEIANLINSQSGITIMTAGGGIKIRNAIKFSGPQKCLTKKVVFILK